MLQTTRLSKIIAAVLVTGFLVEVFVPDTSRYIALVPGKTLPCVWNLVTSGLLTVNPVELVINVAALLLLARLVEPVYGSKEFIKFILLVDLFVGCVVFAAVYLMYVGSGGTTEDLLYQQFCGFHGILAALLVAVKQIMPMHELKLFGTIKFQVKYLPSILLVVIMALALLMGRTDYLAFYIPGTYIGWLYLRFFQTQPDGTSHGDASEAFKFSTFFPEAVAPVIDVVAGVLGMITRLRHRPGTEGAGPKPAAQVTSVLGSDAADANRRRERGAKALEERLGMKTSAAASSPVSASADGGAAAAADVESGSGAQQSSA